MNENSWLIPAIVVAFIVILNIFLFSLAGSKDKKSGITILRESTQTLKNPFHEENKMLEELSSLTQDLQKSSSSQHPENSGESNAR